MTHCAERFNEVNKEGGALNSKKLGGFSEEDKIDTGA